MPDTYPSRAASDVDRAELPDLDTDDGRAAVAAIRPRDMDPAMLQAVVDDSFAQLGRLTVQFPRRLNRRDAIRRKCLDCCAGNAAEVRLCQCTTCPLWPLRLGDDPFHRRGPLSADGANGEGRQADDGLSGA